VSNVGARRSVRRSADRHRRHAAVCVVPTGRPTVDRAWVFRARFNRRRSLRAPPKQFHEANTMGLLSRLMGSAPAKKATDDVLLLHGMLLMAGADGSIEQAELSTVQAFYDTLPEFQGKKFDDLLAQANRIVAKHGGLKDSIKALGEIESPAVRRKCFVLAADIAMASGDIDDAEDKLLEAMQRLLGIDDAFAARVIEVLQTKYTV
jgi:uncharacterized tellurite resistance protein B-like protein